jgi:lysozyme
MNKANKWLLGTVSAAVLAGIATFEGTRTHAYIDMGGVPTVCTGHTGKDIDMNKIYTDAECKRLLVKDIQAHNGGILECITAPITQEEYDAYTIFAFNVGVSAFCGSRANKLLSAGDHVGACKALATSPNGQPAWSYVNGKYVAGLQRRRQFERDMCLGKDKK